MKARIFIFIVYFVFVSSIHIYWFNASLRKKAKLLILTQHIYTCENKPNYLHHHQEYNACKIFENIVSANYMQFTLNIFHIMSN